MHDCEDLLRVGTHAVAEAIGRGDDPAHGGWAEFRHHASRARVRLKPFHRRDDPLGDELRLTRGVCANPGLDVEHVRERRTGSDDLHALA